MDTKHVKNVSGIEQIIVGIGHVAADALVEVPADFHNANFEDVEAPKAESASEKRRKEASGDKDTGTA